ncbi:Arc family DNA-binding protein [Paraburkholderia sp.]|jgi:hypothetical protein|uniref:Arc family DNA-binding protein n=1 Tax=Paraburkholderia sp. TaxID=1926495 RepID=UPI002F40D4FE
MATKPTRAPTAHIVPFGLRLQPDVKVRLEEAATKAGRSLNAEIADRLERSFDEPLGPSGASAPRVDVVLDARGYPISWDEVHEHLAAIRKTGNFNIVAMHTAVVTPEMVSSSEREEKSADLAEFYRYQEEKMAAIQRTELRGRRSTPIHFREAIEKSPPPPGKMKPGKK